MAAYLFRTLGAARGMPGLRLEPEAASWLARRTWPGNVRELRNLLERAVVLRGSASLPLDVGDLQRAELGMPRPSHGLDPRAQGVETLPRLTVPVPAMRDDHPAPPTAEDDREARASRLREALEQAGGNQTEAARLLGISRHSIMRWMSEHGLVRPRKK